MKTKHTSGKWRFDAKHGAICEGEAYSHFCKTLIARVNVDMGEESEANAKLIAAAPELLTTLQWIVNEIENTPKQLQDALLGIIKIKAEQAIRKTEN